MKSKLSFVVSLFLLAHSASAANQTYRYNDLCKPNSTIKMNDLQRSEYCAAAESAMQAKKSNTFAKIGWTAAAATCTLACVSLFAGGPWCSIATTGASTVEAIESKNISTGLAVNLGQAALPFLQSKPTLAPVELPAGQAVERSSGIHFNGSACLSAATANIQAVNKWKGAKVASNVFNDSLDNAEQLTSSSTTPDESQNNNNPNSGHNTGAGQNPGGQGAGSGGILSGGNTGGSGALSGGGGVLGSQDPCNQIQTDGSSSGVAVLNCAMKVDPSLANLGSPEQLARDFEQATGQPFQDFLKNNSGILNDSSNSGSPSKGIENALSTSQLGPEGAKAIGDVFKDLDKKLGDPSQTNTPNGLYASGGGGSGSGSNGHGSGENGVMDPMQAISDLMQQVMGPESGASGALGSTDPNASGQASGFNPFATGRNLASAEEAAEAEAKNTKISIFRRVSKRYSTLTPLLQSQ